MKLDRLPCHTAPAVGRVSRAGLRKVARAAPRSSWGFTLLEILIAVSVFALVLAAINVVFYGALRLRNTAVASFEESLPIQHGLASIQRDFANLVPPGQTLSGDFKSVSSLGTLGQVGPEFCTTTGQIDSFSPWSEVQRVSYALIDSTNNTGSKDLFRLVTRNLLPSAAEELAPQLLLRGVRQLAFTYFDGSQWSPAWDSTSSATPLPRAIKVQLEMSRTNLAANARSQTSTLFELVVPLMVQARTNATQAASSETL